MNKQRADSTNQSNTVMLKVKVTYQSLSVKLWQHRQQTT